MKTGDNVRVFPHGDAGKAAIATVALLAANGRAIAVGFDSRPPFAIGAPGTMAIHPEFGIMLMASREELNGAPWGPWIDVRRRRAF